MKYKVGDAVEIVGQEQVPREGSESAQANVQWVASMMDEHVGKKAIVTEAYENDEFYDLDITGDEIGWREEWLAPAD